MRRKRNDARRRHENLRRALVSPGLTSRAEACLGRRLLLATTLVELPVVVAFTALPASRSGITAYLLYGAAILFVLLRRTLGLHRRPADDALGNRGVVEPGSGPPGSESRLTESSRRSGRPQSTSRRIAADAGRASVSPVSDRRLTSR